MENLPIYPWITLSELKKGEPGVSDVNNGTSRKVFPNDGRLEKFENS